MAQPSTLFTQPFAANGTRNTIPNTITPTTSGAASLDQGFPLINQTPLQAGGIAPLRADFNGILYMLSSFAFWAQVGGLFTYDSTQSYEPPAVVIRSGALYWCRSANGPSGTTQDPATDTSETYWRKLVNSDGTINTGAIAAVTTVANGIMTAVDKVKLNGIESLAQVNQNAFANVKIAATTIAAALESDTLTLAAGTAMALTPNTSNKSVTVGFVSGSNVNVGGSSGSCTGNSATATKLQTARKINGVSFDGTADINIFDTFYPVGSIYMSMNSTSPATLFGGTWVALNQGRVLIGANTDYPASSTGGSSTVSLSVANMPAHNHGTAGAHTHSGSAASNGAHSHTASSNTAGNHNHTATTAGAGGHTHSGTTSTDGAHTHNSRGNNGGNMAGVDDTDYDNANIWPTDSAGAHSHTLNVSSVSNHTHTTTISYSGNHAHTITVASNGAHVHSITSNSAGAHTHSTQGSGTAFSIVQPYIAVYMWYRSA